MTAVQQLTSSGVLVGCSGWQYAHWRGDFYPAALPPSRWLEFYAGRFGTVEVNNSFYRLPEASTFAAWRQRVPRGFVFAVKASRFLTHMKKLKDPQAPLDLFFARATQLGASLGPVLYQLPPRWPFNRDRFAAFLQALPRGRLHAVEFRDPTWYADEALALLARHRVALCLHDMPGSASGRLEVGPFVYVRFHGTQRYGGRYPSEALDEWAEWLAARVRARRKVFAYFNNDVGGHAPRDAMRLGGALLEHLSVPRAAAAPPQRRWRPSRPGGV